MSIFTKIKAVLNGLFRKEVKDAFDTEILLSDAMDIAINDFYKITSGNPRWVDKDDDIRSINFAGYIDNVTAGLVTLDLDIQVGRKYAYESQRGNEHNGNRHCYYRERSTAENLEQHSRSSYQSGYMGRKYADQSQRSNEHNAYEHCNDCERNAC